MSVDDFLKTANKKYGTNTIQKLNGANSIEQVDVIPTGSLSLDAALGIGGYPRGRIVEMLGNPSSGKTTLALHAISEAQKMGLGVLFIDAEHALDIGYAQQIGVSLDKFYISQPDHGEQALQLVDDAIREQEFGIIVVDSVAALVPLRELEGEIGDSHVGLAARMMSQACRKISGVLKKNNVLLLFINQYRTGMATTGYGGPQKVPTGGKALDYYSSIKLDISRIKSIADGDGVVSGNRTKVQVTKNKMAAPYRTAEFDIVFGMGINKVGEIVDCALSFGLITKSGAWYRVGDEKMQGRDSVIEYFNNNEEAKNKFEYEIKQQMEKTTYVGGAELSNAE